jgi:DNA-binding transcriptional regulator WhiA
MARKWTTNEERIYKRELENLYLKQNLTISEVGKILGLAGNTIYDRLKRLGIKSTRHLKKHYNNTRTDILIPKTYSSELAEFFGVMLGDGHISHFQAVVSLGNKEYKYAKYVQNLIFDIFKVKPKILERKDGYRDVYLGSVALTKWLMSEGLVYNKTKSQVDVPDWIFTKESFMNSFIRGFFDTDGSVYKLRYGDQISFSNRSLPLLRALQKILKKLKYNPSRISSWNVYLTRREDLKRFREQIGSNNLSKRDRLKKLQ